MSKVFVIIPVFNESPEVLTAVIGRLALLPHKLIVIDDGSSISIADLLRSFPVTVLTHPVNLGQGAALQTGLEYVKLHGADVVITFDADGQHSADDINHMLFPILNNETDVALGSRFLVKGQPGVPLKKKLLLQAARRVNFIFTGILLSDAHNGFRAFNKLALEKIFISENRMAHASEILFEIKKHRLRFVEVPVNIHYSSYARKKGQSAWDSIKVLFDLVLHKLFK